MQITELNQQEKISNEFEALHLTTPEKRYSIQPQMSNMESDSYFGGNSDCSLEFVIIQFATSPEQKFKHQAEKSILEYLKGLQLKMKTDPRAKQDRYYARVKQRQQKKAQTQVFIKPEQKQSQIIEEHNFSTPKNTPFTSHIEINSNTILQRRLQQSPTSSPLIQKTQLEPKKSKFYREETSGVKLKRNQSFSSSSKSSNGSMHLIGQ